MFRRLDDFSKAWLEESRNTLAVLEAIPDASMQVRIAPGHRDLQRLAWHIVESLIESATRMGLSVNGADWVKGGFICEPPATMKELGAAYGEVSESFLKGLGTWSDSDLEREDEMFGETWRRGFGLYALVTHQAHHRGQMTVLMRQAGLAVPSIYGPVKEGWAAYGVEAPRV